MTWLSENWLLVLLIGGVLIFLMRRGGMGGGMGCGMGGHGSHDSAKHGSHDSAQHGSHRGGDHADAQKIDPVSREPVADDGAISSVYRGRIYRFASRENRDQFEAAPERFATPQEADAGQRRHRGC
jgi:YHS domain-containing protein